MTRRNFARAVRVEKIRAQTRESVVYCEGCGLPCRRFEIHHRDMDAMQIDKSRKLTVADAQLLCAGAGSCHERETAKQRPILAKALAREASHLGAKAPPTKKIESAGFKKSPKTIAREARGPRQSLPPRSLYR